MGSLADAAGFDPLQRVQEITRLDVRDWPVAELRIQLRGKPSAVRGQGPLIEMLLLREPLLGDHLGRIVVALPLALALGVWILAVGDQAPGIVTLLACPTQRNVRIQAVTVGELVRLLRRLGLFAQDVRALIADWRRRYPQRCPVPAAVPADILCHQVSADKEPSP